ncbi:MAG: phosphotransferase enzyme family protein [Roseiflexaceae bacterium]
MHNTEFSRLSQWAQLAALRPIAYEATRLFGVQPALLRCINHGFNTTYAITDATGAKYALRLNTHSLRDRAGLIAEQQWITALTNDEHINVPAPLTTATGAPFVEIPFVPMQKTLSATMARWLPGRIVGAKPSRTQMRQIGALTAHLHRQSAQWVPTAGAQFPLVHRLLMNSHDHLSDAPKNIISTDIRRLIDEVRPRIDAVYAQLNMQMPLQPIHADLHSYNLMWHQNQLAVFDFDDAGLGLPIQDLAITLYYLRDIAYADTELWDGYHSVNSHLSIASDSFELLLMGRGILLLNDLLVLTTPADHEFLPEFVRRMQLRLQHFVSTGRFALLK